MRGTDKFPERASYFIKLSGTLKLVLAPPYNISSLSQVGNSLICEDNLVYARHWQHTMTEN